MTMNYFLEIIRNVSCHSQRRLNDPRKLFDYWFGEF